MYCPICNASNDTEATFCGQCGKQLTASENKKRDVVYAVAQRGANTVWAAAEEGSKHIAFKDAQPFPPTYNRTPAPPAEHSPASTPFTPYRVPAHRFPLSDHKNARNIAFLTIILALVLVGLLASVLTLVQNKHLAGKNSLSNSRAVTAEVQGKIIFSTSHNGQGNTDSLSLSINGVGAITTGTYYAAWLVNEENEQTLALGALQAQKQTQIFMLNVTRPGMNLLSTGNKVEITRETVNATLPTGPVILVAKFPALAFIHIKHLLVSFPSTPNGTGLLIGMSGQAQQLQAQALLLQQNSTDPHTTQCAAQGIINIIEGKDSMPAHSCANLNVTVTGDGFGLLGQNNNNGYVALSAAHASLAATQTDATDTIRKYAQQIVVTTDTLKKWLTSLDQDAHILQTNPGATAKILEIKTLSAYVLNGDATIGGSSTAYRDGQLMATLPLEQWK